MLFVTVASSKSLISSMEVVEPSKHSKVTQRSTMIDKLLNLSLTIIEFTLLLVMIIVERTVEERNGIA